jgi:predicted GTPase
MGENVPIRSNEFNTKLTAYSTTQHGKDIEVDALIVGAGFGKSLSITAVFNDQDSLLHFAMGLCKC